MQSHSGRSIGNVDLLFTDFNCCLCRGADFWNTVGIERLGILSVMLSDEPLAYRGIVIPLLGSYWGGSQGLSSTYEQAHVDLDLLTLAS